MKNFKIGSIVLAIVVALGYYYIMLPPINLTSIEFYAWIIITLGVYAFTQYLAASAYKAMRDDIKAMKYLKLAGSVTVVIAVIIAIIPVIGIVLGPIFHAEEYHNRIIIETSDFAADVDEANFSRLPLLDKASTEKLGDRVLGQLPELISQFMVSEEYTQINYKENIVRVTPLEYNGLIKYLGNRSEGTPGYIIVNSTTGSSELVKLDQGMRYMPSAYLQEDLLRHVRFGYPFDIFGEISFEIDESGKPFWIVQTVTYKGIGLKKEVSGIIAVDPVSGEMTRYKTEEIPNWIDNVWDAELIMDQLNNWGKYGGGFINAYVGQKGVSRTTLGYNYLTQDDDVFMYTGITSASADESNIGFMLVNLRTKEARYYAVPGAEEYSAMESARGQVQEKNYDATFPLLINLNGKATYMLSLKDAAGLVKMYAFVDVQDYQRVTVTDSSRGIENAVKEYLNENSEAKPSDPSTEETASVVVQNLNFVSIEGTTYAYFTDAEGQWYRASMKVGNAVAFLRDGDTIQVVYQPLSDIRDIIELNP